MVTKKIKLINKMDKYIITLLPKSSIHQDGVNCDFNELKMKTINLMKANLNIGYSFDVTFGPDFLEYFDNSNRYFNTISYKKLRAFIK
jgi:hypothetical protein